MEKVSLEATIFNAIQNALDKSYRDESDDAYKTTINSIYKCKLIEDNFILNNK